MLWFIKLSLVLQQSPATMRSCNESYALLGVLQPPATMTVPDKLIKQRVWDREMPAVGRARREQLNAVPQPPADKEQKPALLLPTVPKLLCSPGTWQDAVFLLFPWHLAQIKGVSAFWRPLPGTQSPVWMSSWETLNSKPLNSEQATQLKHWAMAEKPRPCPHSRPEGHSSTQTQHHQPSRLVYWQEHLEMKASQAEGRVPICCQSLRLYPLPFPADLVGHQPGKKAQKLVCFCMGILDTSRNLFPINTVKHRKKLPREVLQSPSLEVLKTQLNQALSNVVWSHSWPFFEHEIELETS